MSQELGNLSNNTTRVDIGKNMDAMNLPCTLLLALLTVVAAQNGLSPSTSPSPYY